MSTDTAFSDSQLFAALAYFSLSFPTLPVGFQWWRWVCSSG